MESDLPSPSDSELRDRILTGLAAVMELEVRFRKPLERFLVGMCDRTDGRSHEEAVEIAGQVLAECFVKTPSLLERWQGGDNLEAFLRTVAGNRLRSWWASAGKKRTEVNSESLSLAHAAGSDTAVDREETELAERALRAGVAAAAESGPPFPSATSQFPREPPRVPRPSPWPSATRPPSWSQAPSPSAHPGTAAR